MIRSLTRYAEANAVVRARMTDLLSSQQFGELVGASSVAEAWGRLRDTAYGEWLPEGLDLDAVLLEGAIAQATALRFKRVLRSLRERPRDVAVVLLSRWELDVLEDALRAWHAKDSSLAPFVTDAGLAFPAPLSQVSTADSIESIARLMAESPYADVLLAAAQAYQDSHSLFHVEVALEKDHYRRLLAAIERLGGSDAREGRRIVGAEIDLVNLAWLSRCAALGELEPAVIRGAMIPSASPVSQRLHEAGTSAGSIAEVSREILMEQMGGEGMDVGGIRQIALIESLVVQSAADAARSLLAGYPFSITCVMAYYFLLRVESRNLRTLFSGKACGVASEELSTRLYGAG